MMGWKMADGGWGGGSGRGMGMDGDGDKIGEGEWRWDGIFNIEMCWFQVMIHELLSYYKGSHT